MSEQHPRIEKGAEHLLQPKNAEHKGAHVEKTEISHAEKQHGNQEHVDRLHAAAETKAVSGKETSVGEREQPKQHPVLVNKQLKDMAFSRAMTRARKKMSAPARAFSKVIHNPAVDKPSEFVGKTVARPTGMLWGAIFAFVGTSALLWITRYYGYEYNYLVAILLFVGGAAIGTALEGLAYALRRR